MVVLTLYLYMPPRVIMFLKFVNWTLNAFNNDSQEYMSEKC